MYENHRGNAMTITNVKAMIAKTMTAGLLAGAFFLASPSKAQAQASWGVHVGVPVQTVYAEPQYGYAQPEYGYYGGGRRYEAERRFEAQRRYQIERHEQWERREQWERQQAYRRHEEHEEHERMEHGGYGYYGR
jgi:hypothetical protein